MVNGRHGLAMVIKIQLRDPQTGSEKTLEFDQSPIRVGRNALNNVVIDDRFVSQWHGVVRFDDASVSYFDLGSTNGTRLGAKRLPKNTATSLRGGAQLGISRFELAVTACPTAAGVHEAVSTRPMNWGEPEQSDSPEAPPLAAPFQGREPDRLARCLRVLQGFSDAFVALKKGYEEFGTEVGVRPLAGSTPLHRARKGGEVMDHLLDPAQDLEGGLRDLKAVFADMGIHHIALMEGIAGDPGFARIPRSQPARPAGWLALPSAVESPVGELPGALRHADRRGYGPARGDFRRTVRAGLRQRRVGAGRPA